jgi:CubicO group peptidase (beta-lactamase class C family)
VADPILKEFVPKLEAKTRQIMACQRVIGAAVGIVRDQELAWTQGFGFADIATERAPDENTVFRCGSITKTFTAAALMQLRDETRIYLDAPIVRYIPEFSAAKSRFGAIEDVTIRRLLTHHSGLVGEGPVNGWETQQFPMIEEIIAALPRTEIVIEKDTGFKYSNLAFALLGEVVARVSLVPYVDYVRRNLFEPLGMNASDLEPTHSIRDRMATGYTICPLEDQPKVAAHPVMRGFTAAGQLYSSVADLSKWISLQFRTQAVAREGSQVLKGSSLGAMQQPHYIDPSWTEGYCLCWMATRRGENIFHHYGGGLPGFLSMAMFNKREKVGAIVLTNATGHAAPAQIAFDLLDTLIPPLREAREGTLTLQKPVATPEKYRQFVGMYEWGEMSTRFLVAVRDGELVLLPPSPLNDPQLPPQRLIPTADPNAFIIESGRSAGERVVFRSAPDCRVVGCLIADAYPFERFARD